MLIACRWARRSKPRRTSHSGSGRRRGRPSGRWRCHPVHRAGPESASTVVLPVLNAAETSLVLESSLSQQHAWRPAAMLCEMRSALLAAASASHRVLGNASSHSAAWCEAACSAVQMESPNLSRRSPLTLPAAAAAVSRRRPSYLDDSSDPGLGLRTELAGAHDLAALGGSAADTRTCCCVPPAPAQLGDLAAVCLPCRSPQDIAGIDTACSATLALLPFGYRSHGHASRMIKDFSCPRAILQMLRASPRAVRETAINSSSRGDAQQTAKPGPNSRRLFPKRWQCHALFERARMGRFCIGGTSGGGSATAFINDFFLSASDRE